MVMSNVITLPRWLARTANRKYKAMDVALVFALSLREHGTGAAIKRAAHSMRDSVMMELRPKLSALTRLNDDQALVIGVKVVEDMCAFFGLDDGEPFPVKKEPEPVVAPRCHMKPMKLAGYHKHKHWRCQHCSHTKPYKQNGE